MDVNTQRKALRMFRRTIFAVLSIGLILVVSACGDSYPTSTAVVTGADDAATAAFQTVNDSYDLYNTGEIEAWVEVRDAGSVWPDCVDVEAEMEEIIKEDQTFYDNGARYVDTVCVSLGLGDWPDIADEGIAAGYYFTCDAVVTRDFEDSTRTTVVEAFNWVVNDGVVVAVNSDIKGPGGGG